LRSLCFNQVYVTTLSIFAHRHQGPATVHVLRGLLYGLFSFTGFFLVLGVLIERVSLAVFFGAAILTELVFQVFHVEPVQDP
jgi:hypothetical protein